MRGLLFALALAVVNAAELNVTWGMLNATAAKPWPIFISSGDSVDFILSQDSMNHTVTLNPLPGQSSFDSGQISHGGSFQHNFNESGY